MAKERKEHTTEVVTFKIWLVPILIILISILSFHFGYQYGFLDGVNRSGGEVRYDD